MVKRSLRFMAFCLLLLLPASVQALDGGDNWRQLSPKERENVLRNYQRWQNLPPKDKEHLREEWKHWESLPQDRRDRLRQRYDRLSPEEQRHLRDQYNGKRFPRSNNRSDD
jgi:hypothetical protein